MRRTKNMKELRKKIWNAAKKRCIKASFFRYSTPFICGYWMHEPLFKKNILFIFQNQIYRKILLYFPLLLILEYDRILSLIWKFFFLLNNRKMYILLNLGNVPTTYDEVTALNFIWIRKFKHFWARSVLRLTVGM